MKKLLYCASLLCVAILGCNESTKVENDKEKSKSEYEESHEPLQSEVKSDQQLQSDSGADGQQGNVEEIAISKAEERTHQVDYRNAKPTRRLLRQAKNLDAEEIQNINNNVGDNPVVASVPDVVIATVVEAFERVNISLSMATAPEVFAEDENNYYFSGGLSVDRIDDFSSGIRVSKNGGAIHVWPSQR